LSRERGEKGGWIAIRDQRGGGGAHRHPPPEPGDKSMGQKKNFQAWREKLIRTNWGNEKRMEEEKTCNNPTIPSETQGSRLWGNRERGQKSKRDRKTPHLKANKRDKARGEWEKCQKKGVSEKFLRKKKVAGVFISKKKNGSGQPQMFAEGLGADVYMRGPPRKKNIQQTKRKGRVTKKWRRKTDMQHPSIIKKRGGTTPRFVTKRTKRGGKRYYQHCPGDIFRKVSNRGSAAWGGEEKEKKGKTVQKKKKKKGEGSMLGKREGGPA